MDYNPCFTCMEVINSITYKDTDEDEWVDVEDEDAVLFG